MTQTAQTTIEGAEIPGGLALPSNVATGAAYQGGNILRLAAAAIEHGWRDMRFGGYNQLQDAGYQVRRGETSTEILVVIGRGRDVGAGDAPAGDTVRVDPGTDDGDGERWRGVRVARVFCVEQCDRMTPEQIQDARERRDARRARAAERRAKGGKRKGRKGSKKK